MGGVIGSAILWSFNITRQCRRLREAYGNRFPPPDFSPVTFFLLYGFAAYQTALAAATEALRAQDKQEEDDFRKMFLERYLESLKVAIGAVNGYLAAQTSTMREATIIRILGIIIGVLVGYRRLQDAGVLNANCMIAHERAWLTTQTRSLVRFDWGTKERYDFYLELGPYAYPSGVAPLILPVEPKAQQSKDMVLPGAPDAFYGRKTAVIDDTDAIRFGRNVPKEIQKEIRGYFDSKSENFRSFASLNIIGKDARIVGVVNVESREPAVFGRSKAEKLEIERLLVPIITLLSFLIEDLC